MTQEPKIKRYRSSYRNRFLIPSVGSVPELAAKLLPTLRDNGRMKVGAAIIRPFRERYFLLDFGRVGGKRVRLFRRTVTDAITTAIQTTNSIRKHGQLAAALNSRQMLESAMCYERLAPIAGSVTLLEIVDDYLKRHPLGGNARTMLDAIAEIVRKKRSGNRRERYVLGLEYQLKALAKRFPDKNVAAITTADLEQWLAEHPTWGPVTQESHCQAYNCFFNFCVKKGYRTDNPVQNLELPTIDKKEPTILTVEQMRGCLVQAMHGPAFLRPCIPWLAIGGFAGVRPEEMEKLQWEHVDFDNRTLTITGENAKTRARRVIDMAENLIAWIRPIARKAGPVLMEPLLKLRVWMRSAMGWARWPSDVLRHSFASYFFAKWKNLTETLHQLGHTGGPTMFFNHYRSLVSPKAAELYWRIIPTLLLNA